MPAETVALARDRNLAGEVRMDRLAASWIKTRIGELRPQRTFKEREWVRDIRAWKMLSTGQAYVGRSNYILPHIRNMVERLVHRVTDRLVGREDFFEVQPSRPEDEDRAEVVKAVMKAQMEEEGFRRDMALSVRDAVVIGTTIRKLRWDYQVENMMVPTYSGDEWVMGPDGPDLRPIYAQELKPRVLRNRPKADRVDPFCLFVDPAAQDIEQTDTVEIGWLSASDILRLVEVGVFDEKAAMRVLATTGQMGRPPQDMGYKQVFDIALGLRGDSSSKKIAMYPFMEFWGWFPLEAYTEEDQRKAKLERTVIVHLGAEEIVRLERNPTLQQEKPYKRGVIIEVPGQFYGESPVRAALPQWMELNDCRNQANDARTFAVNPVMVRGPGNTDDKTSQRVFPGAVITGSNIEFAAFPDTTDAAFKAEQVMIRELEETFGAPRLLDAQGGSDSATEAAIMKEESGARILGYVKTLEDTLLMPELRARLDLCRQFLRTRDAVRIRGASGFDWRPYTPEDFMPQYDFRLLGSVAMQARAMLVSSFAGMTDQMMNFEMLNPGMFDWVRWWSTMFRDGLGIEHPSLYISPLKRAERVPTPDEVVLMLTDGQRPEPDPRQDFLQTLPVIGGFMVKYLNRMPKDIEKNFREYFRKAIEMFKQILMAQQAEAMKAQAEQGAVGSRGGKDNKPIGEGDRDGQGRSTGRLAMKANRKAVQG